MPRSFSISPARLSDVLLRFLLNQSASLLGERARNPNTHLAPSSTATTFAPGVPYASTDYVTELAVHHSTISMSRRGNLDDNAQCERFMRTLKYEEVYLSDYETLREAEASIKHFLEEVYNQKRLHSALGYVPPAEFEQSLTATYP